MVINWREADSVLCVCQQRLQNQVVLPDRKCPLQGQRAGAKGQRELWVVPDLRPLTVSSGPPALL